VILHTADILVEGNDAEADAEPCGRWDACGWARRQRRPDTARREGDMWIVGLVDRSARLASERAPEYRGVDIQGGRLLARSRRVGKVRT
jgi:hypothetical protein